MSETTTADSLNILMRSLGTGFADLAGVVLARMATDFGGYTLPSENGFKVVMAIGAGAAPLAFVVASFTPKRRPEPPASEGARRSARRSRAPTPAPYGTTRTQHSRRSPPPTPGATALGGVAGVAGLAWLVICSSSASAVVGGLGLDSPRTNARPGL